MSQSVKINGKWVAFYSADDNYLDTVDLIDDSTELDWTYNASTVSLTAGLITGSVALSKIADSAGLSVVGRSANSIGVTAAITGTDGQVLRVSGTALSFGTIATAGIADGAVTFAKMQAITAERLLGANGGTAVEEISVGTGLSLSSNSLSSNVTLPTRQTFTSGSAATYTTPAGCRKIIVRAWGGGGGGAGSGGAGQSDGGGGGDSIFNSINAKGGGAGASYQGGQGGRAGSGTATNRIAGCPGQNPSGAHVSATNAIGFGGAGAGPGGGRGGAGGTDGEAGLVNTGGGGGGGGMASAAFATIGGYIYPGGGGSGEYFELVINTPAGTYTYTIGAGGTAGAAGTGGQAGAIGGTGLIIVDEFY
jgi:hypothetical protein